MASTKPTRKIRVGVLGVGTWANHGHLRVLAQIPEYEVVAAFARRREAAAAAARTYKIPHVVDSVAALVNRADVDLVVVLTIAPLHEEAVRAAIAAGKDVYSEWPLTVSSKIARSLIEQAKTANVRHFVGLQRRLAPVTRYVHDLIAEGFIGKIRSARIHVSMNYLQATRIKGLAWTAPRENKSGVIDIYAGHFLDMLFAMIGRPISVSAVQINQFPVVTIKETGEKINTTTADELVVAGLLKDRGVLSVHIEAGKRNNSNVQIDITGDEGDLTITNTSSFGDIGDDYVVRGARGDNIPLQDKPIPNKYEWIENPKLPSAVLELGHLYVAMAEDLLKGTHTAPTFTEAEWMHRLIEGFETSSDTGRHIAVTETESK